MPKARPLSLAQARPAASTAPALRHPPRAEQVYREVELGDLNGTLDASYRGSLPIDWQHYEVLIRFSQDSVSEHRSVMVEWYLAYLPSGEENSRSTRWAER